MLEKLERHTHKAHYLTYCASYVCYGSLVTGLGPLIPYFTERTGIVETEYTYLFSCRSFGMLIGAILLKIMQSRTKVSHHFWMGLASFVLVFATTLFAWGASPFIQGVWMVVSSVGYSAMEIEINICALRIIPAQDLQFWLLLLHGFFGVGGLLGPLVVYALGMNAFPVIGLMFLFLGVAYWKLPEPDTAVEKAEKQGEVMDGVEVPRTAEILLCISLFIYVGFECTYGGWISSYAVLMGAAGVDAASLFPSVFWVIMTIFRFALAFVPGTSSTKMKVLLLSCIGTGLFSMFLVHMGFIWTACAFSAVAYGVSMSSVYILIISINTEYGYTLGQHQTGNIVSSSVLGQGLLTMTVGLFMQYELQSFFYGLLIMPIVLEILRRAIINILVRERKEGKELGVQLLDRQNVK